MVSCKFGAELLVCQLRNYAKPRVDVIADARFNPRYELGAKARVRAEKFVTILNWPKHLVFRKRPARIGVFPFRTNVQAVPHEFLHVADCVCIDGLGFPFRKNDPAGFQV